MKHGRQSRKRRRNGNGFRRTERTTVKSDVDAPIPRAITRIAVTEKLGDRRSVREL